MTVIAVHQTPSEAIVIADSRLSSADPGSGQVVATHDICQKLFVEKADSIVGFSGNLSFGRFLLKGILNRIRDNDVGAAWLDDDVEVLSFARRAVQLHAQKPSHRACTKAGAWITIT